MECDILKTLTPEETTVAYSRQNDLSKFGDDCFQLVRYHRGQIFKRSQAERALLKIREGD